MSIGISHDAIFSRRLRKPKCNPGNKLCGKRCIPQDYVCGGRKDHPTTAATIGRIEDEIRNQPIEYAAAIDPQTGRELFRYKGSSTAVDIPPSEYDRLQGKILTHNHPNFRNWPNSDPRSKGFSFSISDISTARFLGLREIRAVSAGYNHSMTMPRNGMKSSVEEVVSRHAGRIYRQVSWDSWTGRIDKRESSVEYWHRLWTSVSNDVPGMTYKRTAIKADSLFDLSPGARRVLARRSR